MTEKRQTPAQIIKAELKKAFPWVKFSCKYRTFSMWDDVHVSWKGWPLTSEVEAIANQYEAWHFDWMTDMYEYTNDKPYWMTAKYVFCEREDDEEEVKQRINELWEDRISAAVEFGKREWKRGFQRKEYIQAALTSSYNSMNNIWDDYSINRSKDNREKAFMIANYLMNQYNLW